MLPGKYTWGAQRKEIRILIMVAACVESRAAARHGARGRKQRMLTGSGDPKEEWRGGRGISGSPNNSERAMRAGEMCKGSRAARALWWACILQVTDRGGLHRGALWLLACKGPLCSPQTV